MLCGVTVVYLGSDLRSQVAELATANSDNRQWSLVQGEVELLTFESAINFASLAPDEGVGDLRRRFDIFFSRVQVYETAPQFETLRTGAEAANLLVAIGRYLEGSLPLIDAPEAELIAALPALRHATIEIRPVIRKLMLEGLRLATQEAEIRRNLLSATLVRLGVVLSVVVFLLLASVGVLVRLLQFGRKHHQIQMLTQERLAAIADTSLDAIIVADKAGRVIDYNAAAHKTFGYSPQEAIGSRLSDLIVPPSQAEAHQTGLTRYLSTGQTRVVGKGRVRLEAKHKDGHLLPVEISISASRSEGGEIFISFLRDISVRVASERALVEARDRAISGERAKARLLAMMSHEMRTPLRNVIETLEKIDNRAASPENRCHLAAIRRSSTELLEKVESVLDITKSEWT